MWVAALLAVAATGARADPGQRLLAPLVEGSSIYTVRDLAPIISPNIGKLASATVAEQLQAAVSARYVQDGYVSPIVRIPAEDVYSATPHILIYEARVIDVVVRGDPGPYRSRIATALQPLLHRALRKDALRQTLLRINELPGLAAQAVFQPQSGMPNEYLLIVNARYQPVSGEIDINNGGTSQLGNTLYSAALSLNDLLGASDQIQLRGATSSLFDHYQFEDGRIQLPAGASNLSVEVSQSEASPDDNVHFGERSGTLGFDRPLMPLGSGTLGFVFWTHADDNEIHNAEKVHLTDDRIRSAAVGLQYNDSRSVAPFSAYVTAIHAANVAGAQSVGAEESDVTVAFTKYLVGLAQTVPLAHQWQLHYSLDAQATSDVLPLVERFAFGGLGFGEAFDPASLVGDSGAAASVTLGRSLSLHLAAMESSTVYAKAEYGVAWSNATYLPAEDQAAAFSVGVLGKWPHTLITVELSTPLRQPTYAPPASSVRALATAAVIF